MGKICKAVSLVDTELCIVWLVLLQMASVAPWLVIPTAREMFGLETGAGNIP